MTRNNFYRLVVALVIFISAGNCFGQSTTSVKLKHKFTIYGGIGPNFYFNNLELAKDYVNEFNYSIAGRILWEPEHNLGIGIESGYYKLYSVDFTSTVGNGSIYIENIAIPLQLCVSMKFCKSFYGVFSFGRAILKNNVTTTDFGNFDATSISFGDYGLSFGYKKLVSERIFVCSELKAFYSGKLEDKNIALLFMGGFRF